MDILPQTAQGISISAPGGGAPVNVNAGNAAQTNAAQTFSATQTFTLAPIFTSLTGIMYGNGASATTIAVAGTDYAGIGSANTFTGINVVTTATAAAIPFSVKNTNVTPTGDLVQFTRTSTIETVINSHGEYVSNDATIGIVLKDTQGSPHYWRVTVSNVGALVVTDVGTTRPT